MCNDKTKELTALLDQLNGGQNGAFVQLVEMVYNDMRRIAARRMAVRFRRPLASLTESPSAIANAAVMKLLDQRVHWTDSDGFFAAAASLIEHLIADYQKQRLAKKRGGGKRGISLQDHAGAAAIEVEAPLPSDVRVNDGSEVADALRHLREQYPRKAEVATLHILCAHSLPKVSQMVGISLSSAERDWAFAKKWLRRELGGTRS